MNRRTLLKALAAGLAVSAVAGGGVVAWRRGRGARESDVITGRWDKVGHGQWLLPSLDRARLVVPDRPHSKAEAMGAPGTVAFSRRRTCLVSSNADRIRGTRPLEPKPPGGRRWLALGDSVTFGWGVEDHESWPAQLEVLLRSQGHSVEILNYGVPAQRIDAMAEFLVNVAPELQLDGVLLAERPEGSVEAYVQQVRRGMSGLGSMPLMLMLPPISRFDPYGRTAWEREGQQLRRGLGAEVPVVDLTRQLWEAQRGLGADLEIEGQSLRMVDAQGRLIVQGSLPPFDLPPEIYAAFEADHSLKEGLFLDEGHPDAQGFAVLAEQLVPELQRSRWLS